MRAVLETPPEQVDEFIQFVRTALDSYPDRLSTSFQSLFAESCTVASIFRYAYDDEPSEAAAAADFLSHSIRFFNSFTHR